jgi:solute carrier family 39 (zinc transporter), member 1/2/3
MGVMLHSFVLGVTMAVATPRRFASLLPGILFHQTFEGIAIGVRLANIASPSLFPEQPDDSRETNRENERNGSSGYSASPPTLIHPPIPSHPVASPPPTATQRILPPLFAVLFSVPIPFILLLSFFIPALQSRDSLIPPHHTNTTITPSLLPSSPSSLADLNPPLTRATLLQGVTSAVSAGLLIYVSCIELLAGDFFHDASMQKASARKQGGAIAAFIAGALGMSCL